jgi:hypothetical protein
MKVHVSSVASIDARRLVYQGEVARIAMVLAGKKTTVEMDPVATVGDLVAAAGAAFSFPESLNIQGAYLVIDNQPIEEDLNLAQVKITEDSTVQVRFLVILA